MGKIPKEAKLVFKGKIFDVYQWPQQLYDGTVATFEMLKRPDTVFAIPVTPEGQIVIADQEQPSSKPSVGLLGGRVDEGETPEEAVKRELLEEGGMISDNWELLYQLEPYNKIEWTIHIYAARNTRKIAEQSLDGGEKISLKYVSFAEFVTEVLRPDFDGIELKQEVMDAQRRVWLESKLMGR